MYAPRTCAYCGGPLPLSKETGRPSRFCPGSNCRVAAHRARSPVGIGGFVTSPGTLPSTTHRHTKVRNETPGRASYAALGASKTVNRRPLDPTRMRWTAPDGARIAVRSDPIWPGMFRVHHAGHISDMVNLSRARDAAQALAEEFKQ
jgi:hypothetical protein